MEVHRFAWKWIYICEKVNSCWYESDFKLRKKVALRESDLKLSGKLNFHGMQNQLMCMRWFWINISEKVNYNHWESQFTYTGLKVKLLSLPGWEGEFLCVWESELIAHSDWWIVSQNTCGIGWLIGWLINWLIDCWWFNSVLTVNAIFMAERLVVFIQSVL